MDIRKVKRINESRRKELTEERRNEHEARTERGNKGMKERTIDEWKNGVGCGVLSEVPCRATGRHNNRWPTSFVRRVVWIMHQLDFLVCYSVLQRNCGF